METKTTSNKEVYIHGRVFTEHKSPLGWYFTAEEEARAGEVCRISEQWFNKHYAPKRDRRIVTTNYANYGQKNTGKAH